MGNFKKCIIKIDKIMEANLDCQNMNKLTRFHIEEFLSGGEKINAINDLSPTYSNLSYN